MRKDRDIYYKPDPNTDKREETAGEHVFSEITYRGVDFAANAAFGVTFTYITARTKFGQRFWGKPVYNLCRRGLDPFFKSEETLQKGAARGRDFASIIMGGTAIILPIMALESNKESIVKTLDKRIYGNEEVENNPRFAAAYNDIAHEPQKSFSVGMAARFVSLAPLIYAEVKYPDACERLLHAPIGSLSKAVTKRFGITGEKLKAQKYTGPAGQTVDAAGNELNHWNFLHNIIGMDFGLTFFYSFMHEYSYKGLSHLFHTPKDESIIAEKADSKTAPVSTVKTDSIEHSSQLAPTEPQPPSHQMGA